MGSGASKPHAVSNGSRPYGYGQHLHNYRVVNRSQRIEANGLRWIERCRCGCTVICESQWSLATRKAQVIKTWFDREGQLQKVTGYAPAMEPKTVPDLPETKGD